MENTLMLIEIIVFIIIGITFILYGIKNIMEIVLSHKLSKKFNKEIEETANVFINKIKEAKVEVRNESNNTRNNNDYNNMNISELKKIAKDKKIKAYYNMKKKI